MLVSVGKSIGAGCAASSLIGAGVGIGIVFSSLIYSYCSNPDLQGQLFVYAMLGFALCEATALFGLMIVFIILFG